jgi:sugar lactone lactonase YvrE
MRIKAVLFVLIVFMVGCAQQNSILEDLSGVEKADASINPVATVMDIQDTSEGIAFDGENLYVTSYRKGMVLKIDSNNSIPTTFLSGLNKPAGIAFNLKGELYICEYGAAQVTKLSGKTRVNYTQTDKGKLKGPNGIAVSRQGIVFLSDSSGVVAKIQDNQVTVLANLKPYFFSLNSPTGLALNALENILYINDSGTGDIWMMHLDSSYNMTKLEKMPLSYLGKFSKADGIALDKEGFLYITYNLKKLVKIDPFKGNVIKDYGDLSKELKTPANIAFGNGKGFDPKALYITQMGDILFNQPTASRMEEKIKKIYIGIEGLSLITVNRIAITKTDCQVSYYDVSELHPDYPGWQEYHCREVSGRTNGKTAALITSAGAVYTTVQENGDFSFFDYGNGFLLWSTKQSDSIRFPINMGMVYAYDGTGKEIAKVFYNSQN